MDLATKLGSRFKTELISQIIVTGTGALLIISLTRLLESDGYGLLFLAVSVFSVAKMFSELGLANSAARYIAEYREKDPSQIPHILKRSLMYILMTISIVAIVFILGHEYIAIMIGEPVLVPLLELGILYIIFETLAKYVRLISQGFEDIGLAATIHATNRSIRFVFAVGFVFIGYEALGALGGFIIGSSLASLLGLIAIYVRYYREIPEASIIEAGLFRRLLEYNIPLTITSLSGKIDKNIDIILVGFFLNPVAVSYYVLSKQIATFVQVTSNALGFSISPTYGTQKTANNLETAARIFEESLRYILLLYIPAAIGIIFVAEPMIMIVFGSSYLGATPVLQILSIFVVFSAITNITDHPLDYLGKAKIRSIAKLIASLSNVILNIILIPILGVIGAAIATVITHSLYISVKLYIMSIELPLNRSGIMMDLKSIGFVVSGMAVIVWLLSQYISGPLSLGLVILAGVVSWGILSVHTGVIDYEIVIDHILS